MPDEGYFLAFGALGISLAGFAGLIAGLRSMSRENPAFFAFRIRTIVILGFSLTVVGFGTVAAFGATGDVVEAIRIGSVLLLTTYLRGLLVDTRPGPLWPDERQRRVSVGIITVLSLATVANVGIAAEGYLQVLLLAGLLGPISIFYATIHDATEVAPAVSETGPRDVRRD